MTTDNVLRATIVSINNELFRRYQLAPGEYDADALRAAGMAMAKLARDAGIDVVQRDYRPFNKPDPYPRTWPPEGWASVPGADGWYFKDAEMLTEAQLRDKVST